MIPDNYCKTYTTMKFFKIFLAALLAVLVAGIIKFIFWFSVLGGMMASMDSGVKIKNNSVLTLDFAEIIADAPSNNPLAGFDLMSLSSTGRISLYDALRALDAAAADKRIKGIYIHPALGGGPDGWAVAEELRGALEAFKQSGKFVVAYDDGYSQAEYYLASVADKIFLQPMGAISWQGLAFTNIFYKGLFDKLGVEPEIFRPTVCKYKSAVEPYFLTRMSDANRLQMQELADAMWSVISGEVAEARGMDAAKLNELTDKLALCEAGDALKNGFVDGLLYEDEVKSVIAELSECEEWNRISFGDYASQVGPDISNLSAPQVAVLYAQGGIVDGNGTSSRGEEQIFGNTLAARIAALAKDDDVKAVVVRVNSPGGSALASDVIWREMTLLREKKPVIVSMGAYAASGGYYISAPADAIVTDKLTLTGSIGVFGFMINPTDALRDKLGITFDGVKTNTSADMGGLGHTMTADERAFMMRSVDKVYGRFTSLVAEGRNLPLDRVLDIAEGRVWAGTTATQIGLADMCGGLKSAIAVAADKAGLDKFRVVEKMEEPDGFAAVFSSLKVSIRERILRSESPEVYDMMKRVREALSQNGVSMYSDVRLDN